LSRSAVTTGTQTAGQWWWNITSRFARAGLVFGHGTRNARDEAAWLVCHVLGIRFEDLAGAVSRPVSHGEARRLERLTSCRTATRDPLAYLLHEAWLAGHRFYVDRRVIVPRSHIAELLPGGLGPWAPRSGPKRILDLCTGSGCLAILAALAFPRARVDASDISAGALAVARRNVEANRLRTRVRLIKSDLFSALGAMRYDLIVCNPPYVPRPELRRLPAEYRAEPRVALAGGRDGLDFVRRLLAEAARHLTWNGALVVEIGANRGVLERAMPSVPFTWLATRAGEGLVFTLRREELVPQRNQLTLQ
jgi:ribosomal protein L3 glutamine methyltransferase